MTAPIDRLENVRASVDDVERQMQATQAAGVMIPPTLAWRLLSECRSLLGPTLTEAREQAWAEGYAAGQDSVYTSTNEWPNPAITNPYAAAQRQEKP